MSGGSGTRLWPLSRTQHPKQYLSLASDHSLLQETILRLQGLGNLANPMVVCNVEHRFLVAEQCREIGIQNPIILLEPVGRNTAPAIMAAALQSNKQLEDAILLVLSADHVIQDVQAFHTAIDIATQQAQVGQLVTFGIVPSEANTGYGYIKSSKDKIGGAYQVEDFVEKPDLKTAQSYYQQNNYLWNSGMFMFRADTVIDELSEYAPEISQSVSTAVNNATLDIDFIRLDEQAFSNSPSDSIDYALMEKSNKVVVVPLNAQWSDIGSWDALYDISQKDNNQNVIKGDVIVQDTTNTYINANHHIVATIGVDNLIIVDTPNATLVASRDKSKAVKAIVEQLRSDNRHEAGQHRKVYRPWGWYDSIETGDSFQVKRLHIKIGAKLSLQRHSQRAEHWVVVKGIASVVNGDKSFTLQKGQSTYIPIGVKHSLANEEKEDLEVIEVQSGVYLGEDDIERFEDIYGRVKQ